METKNVNHVKKPQQKCLNYNLIFYRIFKNLISTLFVYHSHQFGVVREDF